MERIDWEVEYRSAFEPHGGETEKLHVLLCGWAGSRATQKHREWLSRQVIVLTDDLIATSTSPEYTRGIQGASYEILAVINEFL